MKNQPQNQGSKFEQYFYESRPYFYVTIGVFALLRAGNSTLMWNSGLILVTMAAFVLHARHKYRSIMSRL